MKDDIPYLTITDKINTCMLEENTRPALIIEGKTDFIVYSRMLIKSELDWNKIDIVVGESKSNILKYHDEGLDFNYLILLDSDYERYEKKLREDDNIIYTHFYNMENYLTTEDVLERTIDDFVRITCRPNCDAKTIIKEAISSIEPFIVACLIKKENNLSMKLEDISIEDQRYWSKRDSCIKLEEFKKFLLENCRDDEEKNKVKTLWDKQYASKKEFIMIKFEKGEIDLILNGKQKLNSIYHVFFNKFKIGMKGRNIHHFISDLCKNLLNSKYIAELVIMIDSHISKYMEDKEINAIDSEMEEDVTFKTYRTAAI